MKNNLTQQKETCVCNKIYKIQIYNNTYKTQITKASLGRILRRPAWKWNGPILEETDKYGNN